MNLNGDEKRIQQLFREMSRDDELRMPAFSRVVHGGGSSVAPFRGGVSRRLAWAFAMLCVAVLTLAIVTLRHQSQVARDDQVAAHEQPSESSPSSIAPAAIPPTAVKANQSPIDYIVKRVRHRHRPSNELALAIKLSTWRSPTASLLTTSGDDKLMSLPKLGESLRSLRFYSLDELN
jgi:hypothetical protein